MFAVTELFRLCKIAIAIPVSSAGCERSFSSLKLIKTYLRNRMSDNRLSNLRVLHIEKELSDWRPSIWMNSSKCSQLSTQTWGSIYARSHFSLHVRIRSTWSFGMHEHSLIIMKCSINIQGLIQQARIQGSGAPRGAPPPSIFRHR